MYLFTSLNYNAILRVSQGYASGIVVSGANNYALVHSEGGLIEDVIVDSGSLYLANGGLVRNITVRNGATPVLRGETPYCSGATIEGGTLQFQNGGKGQDTHEKQKNIDVYM